MAIFRTTNVTNQIKENLVMRINEVLLNNGYYNNVSVGEVNFLSNPLSTLFKDLSDPSFVDRQVWKAPKDNWVFEENITVPSGIDSVILPSGVYINGTFYEPDDATFGHIFDYQSGRVIFTSGNYPANTDSVQTSYAYKEVRVGIADKRTRHALNNDYFENDGVFDSVFPSGTVSGPAIYIDSENVKLIPKAIGGGVISYNEITLHCISNDQYEWVLEDIADQLMYMQYEKLHLIDVDQMPEIIDWRGTKTASYQDYTVLKNNSNIRYNSLYFLKCDKANVFSQKRDWNRVRINILTEVRGVAR